MENKNLVGLWVNISRAYEIAKLGGFTIQIIFNKEYTQGYEDYAQIKKFYKDVDFAASGDLIVEITKPDYRSKSKYETLSDINERIKQARKVDKPKNELPTSAESLLKSVINRLNLSVSNIDKVIEVSAIIAQLSRSKDIKVEHVAEAIHYNLCLNDEGINAESENIFFGKGVSISRLELDPTDINNAIDYLKTLL